MESNHLFADIPCKALIRNEGKILFVLETDGTWGLPGGRMDKGEMPRESLKREIREELGVEIEIGNLVDCTVFTSANGIAHFVVAFDTRVTPGQEFTIDPKEIAAVEWVEIPEILKRNMHVGSRLIVERLV